MPTDFVNGALSVAKTAVKGSAESLNVLTKSGTVIGAIAGGGVAGYNIISNFINGKSQSWTDFAGLGLAVLGVGAEMIGVGEAYDGVAVTVSVATVGLDIYNAATIK